MTTLPPITSLSLDPEMEPRRIARALYWQGYRVARIAEMLGKKPSTIHSWKQREQWDRADAVTRVGSNLETRMAQLIAKENKEGKDFKEIDLLGRQIERLARVRRYEDSGNESELNPKVAQPQQGATPRAERNAISDEEQEQLVDAFEDSMFDYQRARYEAGLTERIRNILKSRQIGATWYFAREAFIDALTTGRNQIFLSASKAQAHVFKQCIIEFAKGAVGVDLKGDPMVLPNGATLYFLGTNARTAQSYHGNLYLDKYFWIQRFQELQRVASGMTFMRNGGRPISRRLPTFPTRHTRSGRARSSIAVGRRKTTFAST